MRKINLIKALFFSLCLFIPSAVFAQGSPPNSNPNGYRDIPWGASVAEAQAILAGVQFTEIPRDNRRERQFPEDVNVRRWQINEAVAGYPARTDLYFYNDRFFQAVVRFNTNRFLNFDFNYNVFISVDRYYNYIRSNTLNFIADIYALLAQRYGQRQPTFQGLDPRNAFVELDNYIGRERWNLRYNPSEYFRRIQTQSFAQWRFPRTEVRFSVIISAFDRRFEWTLSLASNEILREVERSISNTRQRGL